MRSRALTILEVTALVTMSLIIVAALHPQLLFSSSLVTGGDTGAHLALPAYLRSTGNLFNLTPWYPGWFAGMPAYTYYFVVPDYLAVLGSYLVGFALAFKLVTVLGSVTLPVAAYLMGRLWGAARPVPLALAVATMPFLFDATYTIDGGNLFSTLAGEYAFSLSLSFALVAIGLLGRGMRTSRGYWITGIVMALTLLSHVLPLFFVVGVGFVMALYESLHRRGRGDPLDTETVGDFARPWRFLMGSGAIAITLSAWWLVPFLTTQQFTNSMGYTNDPVGTFHDIFKVLGWFNASGGASGDRWVIVMAAIAAILALIERARVGLVLTFATIGALLAFIVDPQGVIWNERLVPFWFLGIHLLAGWLVGHVFTPHGEYAVVEVTYDDETGESQAVFDEDEGDYRRAWRTAWASVAVFALGLASFVPGQITPAAQALGLSTAGNQVSDWARWNYNGYQGQTAWPEYHHLMTVMTTLGHTHGCGRAMWEYGADQNRFGTPMALMLLPYWTENCISSMEGLFFESSATTPYHFINQSELSTAPSNPQVGLPYSTLDMTQGVRHLQMLGVKYYLAYSPAAVAAAARNDNLIPLTTTKSFGGASVRWHVYEIRNSVLVESLRHVPNVVPSLNSRTAWLNANASWWIYPQRQAVYAAASGPPSWPHVSSIFGMKRGDLLPRVKVTRIHASEQSLSFHVDTVGVPMLVKISYFPRWHVTGATGPYRVSPNLMAVVPTSHDVTMTYGADSSVVVGNLVTDAGVIVGAWVFWRSRRRQSPISRIASRGNEPGL